VLPPFASKYCVSFEPYFLVSVSANIFVQICVVVLPLSVTVLLLFCPSNWCSQGALQVP